MKNDGRPQKYSDEELLIKLKEYRVSHTNSKIRLSDLERETEIPTHIWKYRMKDYIDEINKKTLEEKIPENSDLDLPSASEMVENCEGNLKLLEDNIAMLLDIIFTLYSYKNVAKTISDIKTEYENEISRLQTDLNEKEKQITALNRVLNMYIIDSASKKKREEKSIKGNVIQFDSYNLEHFNKMFHELTK